MSRAFRALLLIGTLVAIFIATEVQAASSTIAVINVKGVINPVLATYISRSIEYAEEENASVCIIQMDTPGGLDSSMREIIQDILDAKVPVVVYVSPSGSRAASAGTFITLAAHVAVMAPNTAIGAATPVSLEGEMTEDMKTKIINDAVAYIRSIAQSHGRNADWAEKAVREGASISEREALEINVIDMIASDINALIPQLDGRQVTMLDGSTITLNTQDSSISNIEMNWIEGFLYAISDPNIAYILLSLATIGLLVEITTPGIGVPGIAGAICLIIAFFSLGTLPVNYAGLLLMILAFGLFIVEVFTPTFGLFTAGGVTALVIGSLILFGGGSTLFRVNPWLIAVVAIIIVALLVFIINRVVSAHHRPASTGREGLLGQKAVVKTALDPEGTVLLKGERWRAISEVGRVEPGKEVLVTKVEGLKVFVK